MRIEFSRRASLALVSAVSGMSLFGFAGSARANLTITPVFGSTITSDPNAAAIEGTINTVVTNLDSYLANPVTVTITFNEATTGLGESSSSSGTVPYSSYLSALQTKQTLSPVDTLALASLGPTSSTNPVNGTANAQVSATLLTALGYNVGTLTASMQFNASIINDSRTGPQVVDNYDLQSVVTHEVDEILGIGGPGSVLGSAGYATGPVGQLDLFRYSAPGVRSFSPSSSVSSYFSIDGGVTDLVHFNQAGDGDADYADWGNGATNDVGGGNTPPQVQDAFGSPYVSPSDANQPNLGSNELTAFDAVGWDLTPAGTAIENGTAVPEPTSIALVVIGGFGFLARRRRAAK